MHSSGLSEGHGLASGRSIPIPSPPLLPWVPVGRIMMSFGDGSGYCLAGIACRWLSLLAWRRSFAHRRWRCWGHWRRWGGWGRGGRSWRPVRLRALPDGRIGRRAPIPLLLLRARGPRCRRGSHCGPRSGRASATTTGAYGRTAGT